MIEKNKLGEILINKTAKSLKNNFFDVIICNNKVEIIKQLTKLIDKKSIIGYGGSKTLDEINFFETFKKDNYPNILDRKNPSVSNEEKLSIQHKALSSDFFICSANALSQTGEIVLIDMWGNRCGAMTYGPNKKIFIIGRNKITYDLPGAIERAKNTASVLNNIRFNSNNPCTLSGKCMDCNSKDRICSVTTLIHRCQPPKSILVILVNEDLGF